MTELDEGKPATQTYIDLWSLEKWTYFIILSVNHSGEEGFFAHQCFFYVTMTAGYTVKCKPSSPPLGGTTCLHASRWVPSTIPGSFSLQTVGLHHHNDRLGAKVQNVKVLEDYYYHPAHYSSCVMHNSIYEDTIT